MNLKLVLRSVEQVKLDDEARGFVVVFESLLSPLEFRELGAGVGDDGGFVVVVGGSKK